jgi:hypothetical protein
VSSVGVWHFTFFVAISTRNVFETEIKNPPGWKEGNEKQPFIHLLALIGRAKRCLIMGERG